MPEQTPEQLIRGKLQELSIDQLTQVTNKFLSSLEQRYPATAATLSCETELRPFFRTTFCSS